MIKPGPDLPQKKWSKILREAAKKGYNFSCRATKTAAGGGGVRVKALPLMKKTFLRLPLLHSPDNGMTQENAKLGPIVFLCNHCLNTH